MVGANLLIFSLWSRIYLEMYSDRDVVSLFIIVVILATMI